MSPTALLGLWRDRWAKPDISALFLPYRDGKLSRQLEAFALSQAWRSAVWRWLVRLLATAGLIAVAWMPLSTNAQIVLSFLLLAVVVYVRRFASPVVALAIASLSSIMSLRYFEWRLTSSIPISSTLWVFACAFIWWVGEVFSWVLATLKLWSRFWPTERELQLLPSDAYLWPTVDVLLWVDGATPVQLQDQVRQWRTQDWPENKMVLKLASTQTPDPASVQWAHAQRLELVHYPESAGQPWSQINRQLWDLQGDYIIVVGPHTSGIESGFLQQALGWMQADPSLGWLHTPTHALTGARSGVAQELQKLRCAKGTDVAVLRRSAVLAIGGLGFPLVQPMRANGWESAHLLTSAATGAPQGDGNRFGLSLIDRPFPKYGLYLRMRLQAFADAMGFYSPVWKALFAVVPLVAVVLPTLPLQSTLLALVAFYGPHWLMWHLAEAESEYRGRLTFSLLLREKILPLHLLVRTTLSFSQTQMRHLLNRCTGRHVADRDPAIPIAAWGRAGVWALLNLLLAGAAARQLWDSPQLAYGSALLVFACWPAWNALRSIAGLAVDKEAALIEVTRQQRRAISAMVQMPGQRPLPGKTVNFPGELLEVQLVSTAPQVGIGRVVAFSLFHGYHEYPFEGQVVAASESLVRIHIAPSSKDAYHLLGAAVFSRDANWPRWLPGRDADHLLPSRVRAVLAALETAFYNLVVQATKPPLMQWLKQWLRPGIKNNG